MADDAREVTVEQAQAYQTTGKKLKVPKAKTGVAMKGPGAKAVTDSALAKVYVRVENSQDEKLLLDLKKTIDANQGDTDVILVMGPADNRQAIKLPAGIRRDETILNLLGEVVGRDNVKVQ